MGMGPPSFNKFQLLISLNLQITQIKTQNLPKLTRTDKNQIGWFYVQVGSVQF